MEEMKKVTNDLAYMFLKRIVTGLRDGSIDVQRAKLLARLFINLEPFNSIDDAKVKMHTFATQNPHFQELDTYMTAYHEEKKIGQVIDKMRKYMKDNDIDNALAVATHP